MHGPTFVADLALVLGVAALTSVLARLLRQPSILGYLFAGLIVGPNLPVPLFADEQRVAALAEFGVILVMFTVGLEFRIRRLLSVLPTSGLTGLVQVSFLLWCGFSLGQVLGWTRVESVFLGASLCISSTMVVSGVLSRAGAASDVRRHVLGVLVVQDVLAIALIAAMTAIAAGGGLGSADLLATLGRLAAVLLGLTAGGLLVVPRLVRLVSRLQDAELLSVLAMALCFGLALLAEALGYSVALGAFLAGVLVAESGRAGRVGRLLQPLRDVFAAIFFVSIGMTVDPALAWQYLPASLLATAVVILAQLSVVTGTGLLSGLGLRRSLTAGLALGQIGEFGFILAAIGVGAGVVGPALQPVIVSVAVLTTFSTPHLFGLAERLVHAVDGALPRRVRQTVSLHEAWIERLSSARRDPAAAAPWRRLLRVVALDGLGLILVAALGTAWLPELSDVAASLTGLTPTGATAVAVTAILLVLLPGLVGLLRCTLGLARLVAASVAGPGPSATSQLAAHTVSVIVVLGVVLAVGMPFIAVLRPLLDHAYAMPALLLVVALLAVSLWRQASVMTTEYRSGAESLAAFFASQGTEDEDEEGSHAEHGPHAHPMQRVGPQVAVAPVTASRRPDLVDLLPGLDSARFHDVPSGGLADGASLAELDLRARSGATVVAIQRGDERQLLPTGSERLRAGDRLVLVGAGHAVDDALRRLNAPAEREPDGEEDDDPVGDAVDDADDDAVDDHAGASLSDEAAGRA